MQEPRNTDGLHDRIAKAVLSQYDGLPGRAKPQGRAWTVLAGIVAETHGDLEVLALATGTRCIGVAAMVAGCGQVVHDCHAEVLCRRAFHRFLLGEMLYVSNDGQKEQRRSSILEMVRREELLFSLRSDVNLHFYVSALPCGECTLVPLQSKEGTLARKMTEEKEAAPLNDRNRTGAKPSRGMPNDPKAEGKDFHQHGILRYKSGRSDTRPESRTVCYSCSDKICRWNRVGWQGALLSRLVKGPLQMQSIVIGGSIYDGGFVQQALFGRALAPPGIAPEFCHTTLVFHSSREAAEADEASSKVSTPGLSLVWNAEQRSGVSTSSRPSKSEKITGFYDVLIGHTGQRQGLRNDRQAKRLHSEPDSWVSPLCKKFVVQDLLTGLRRMLGGDEALAEWLKCSNSERRKRPRVEPALCLENKEKPANGRRASAQFPSYAWLKEMLTSEDYGAARKEFHSGEPFCHWWRKQTIQFENDECGVDGFKVDLLSDIFTSNSTEFAIPLCRDAS